MRRSVTLNGWLRLIGVIYKGSDFLTFDNLQHDFNIQKNYLVFIPTRHRLICCGVLLLFHQVEHDSYAIGSHQRSFAFKVKKWRTRICFTPTLLFPFFRGYTVLKGVIPPIPTISAINRHTIRNNPAQLVTPACEECHTVDRKLLRSFRKKHH